MVLIELTNKETVLLTPMARKQYNFKGLEKIYYLIVYREKLHFKGMLCEAVT